MLGAFNLKEAKGSFLEEASWVGLNASAAPCNPKYDLVEDRSPTKKLQAPKIKAAD
jgi:hypothetical protein